MSKHKKPMIRSLLQRARRNGSRTTGVLLAVATLGAGAMLYGGSVANAAQQVATGDIAHLAVTQPKLATHSVSTSKIGNGTVGYYKLKAGGRKAIRDAGQGGGSATYTTFTSTQNFGPGGIGGVWCGAPATGGNSAWTPVAGGAKLTTADINAGFVVASSWQNTTDPENPGWNFQLNKPPNKNPGDVTMTVVCVK